MGILGLAKLLYDKAGGGIKQQELHSYFGRRIAIDASMSIYQFIIAMKGFQDGRGVQLTNDAGQITSHLNGIFTRTLRMIDQGIKPIYVFDGTPPTLKAGQLAHRRKKADEAQKAFEEAKDAGDDEAMQKMSKRTVRVNKEQTQQCKKLLKLMGLPVIQAPSEAQAQCAQLVKSGKAWAVATEDMDALTFGSSIMLRHINISQAKKQPIAQFHLNEILRLTQLSMDQFIDLCILLGCDYVPKISGIGPQKAYDGIQKYGNIESFISTLDKTKHTIPADFLYDEARSFFKNPDVIPGAEAVLQFNEPDEQGLIQFLVNEKLFNIDRVKRGVQRLRHALNQKPQGRLEDFFKITKTTKVGQQKSNKQAGHKRGRDEDKPIQMSGSMRRGPTGFKKAVKK